MRKIDLQALRGKISAHTEDDLANGVIGSAEIMVAQSGGRMLRLAFGACMSGASSDGVVYRLASMTKPITAVAVLREAETGRLGLYEPISRYYPDLPPLYIGKTDGKRVTPDKPANGIIRIVDLLTHTNGIVSFPNCDLQPLPDGFTSLDETVRFYLSQPLQFDPGTAQSYSPTAAFDVAARIVELTSGLSFPEYLRKYIFNPLGMKDTGFDPSPAQWARMIPMHLRTADGKSSVREMTPGCVFERLSPSISAAGAGLASTLADYALFAEMLLNEGVGSSGARILSADSVRLMRTPHVPESLMNASERWGLGVRVVTRKTGRYGLGTGCFGWSGAYGTHFWIDPKNRLYAIYMKNSAFDGGAGCRTGTVFENDVMASL